MKTLLTLFSLLMVSTFGYAQTIEKFSIDSGGASATAGGIQILYTIGEVNVQELNEGNVAVSEGFINADFKVLINPQIFLQGPLLFPSTAGLMNDILREDGLIPTTSPYADNATCNASVFNTTGNNAIVDWVWLELRASNDTGRLINGRSALVQRDGDVVDVDGTSGIVMQASPTNYYVVVKHRNHLGAMSSATIALSDTATTVVDFTNSGFATFGSNAQVLLGSGDTALWAGDSNGNGQIRYLGPNNDANSIKDVVLGAPGNATFSNFYPYAAYSEADLNLNGQVRYLGPGNDTNLLKDIVLSHPSNASGSNFFPFVSQVPAIN